MQTLKGTQLLKVFERLVGIVPLYCLLLQPGAALSQSSTQAAPTAAIEKVPSQSSRALLLENLLEKSDFIQFAQQLQNSDNLTPKQVLYFRGVLAYRKGDFDEARKSLIAAVNTRDSSLTANQVADALETLGDTAAKTYQYGATAQMYDDVDKAFGAKMGDEVKVIREKRHIGAVLQHVPAQTIEIAGEFSLKRTGKEYPVSVGGKSFSAELDTGAAFSIISETTAKNWDLTTLEGTVTLHGYGGGTFSAHPAVIPVLRLGKAELHNVVVFVASDDNLYISEIRQQTNALLGYPVVSALGCLTFAKDGTLTVSPSQSRTHDESGAAMWIGNSSLLITLDTMPLMNSDRSKVTGSAGPRLFELDTGSSSTFLTDHYLAEHPNVFVGPPTEKARLAGAGGIHEIPAYPAHQLPLWFGSTPVFLNGEHVLSEPQGGVAENYFGVIGQDLLQLFSSYTVDFVNMRFTVMP
jgi:hypothetical protein